MPTFKNLPLDPLHFTINLVGEEGTEISHQTSKIFRFGLSATDPRTRRDNLQCLQGEVTDLIASIRVLNLELVKSGLPPIVLSDEQAIQRRIEKIGHYASISIDLGTLSHPLAIMT